MTSLSARRAFLKRGTVATAILGFPFLHASAQEGDKEDKPAAPKVDLLALARARMKQETKPGVILVIPLIPATAVQRAEELGRLLGVGGEGAKLDREIQGKGIHFHPIGGGDPAAQRVFCQAVFVCLPLDEVKQLLPDVKPDTAAVLLDLNGKPIDTLASAPELFARDFAAKMGRFLHGARGERLADVVQAQRAALGAAQSERCDVDLRNLDADGFATRQDATRRLAEVSSQATALLAAALQNNPTLEARRRIEGMLDELYAAAPHNQPGLRTPYGVEWGTQTVDPCPPCGLSEAPHPSRLFLRFVANGGKK